MSQTKIEKLTPEQEALIPVYMEKWRAIAVSTERINRNKAAEAIKAAYAEDSHPPPNILFFDSPYAAFLKAIALLGKERCLNLGEIVRMHLDSQIEEHISRELRRIIGAQLWVPLSLLENNLERQLWNQIQSQLDSPQRKSMARQFFSYFQPDTWYCSSSLFDFCISVLNGECDPREWEIFQSLIKECGWIFAFEKTCLVCDRPSILYLDSENRLHAEGYPAIEFEDGYKLYAYHGVTVPKKYGNLPPRKWKPEWLLAEQNSELRRVLIQGIGYSRICQALQTIALDSWREYTLLKLNQAVDVEPIYLLTMTCPSTGFIHALRVPPEMQSAKEAITWVNWGIEPEEFAIET